VLKSTAVVATDAPERYAKQLLSHLGRKNPIWAARTPSRRLTASATADGWYSPTAPGPSGRRATSWCSKPPPRTPTRSPMPKTCWPATWSGSGQNASWW
jgi:hypothetical protein